MDDLHAALARRAERGSPRGAGAVLADARRSTTSSPSHKPLLVAAAIVAVLAMGVGIALVRQDDKELGTAGAPQAEFCRLLADRLGTGRDRLSPADVVIFIEPRARADAIAALRGQLETDSRVARFDYKDQQAAYEEFSEIFADSPEMIESVTPESLPPSYLLRLEDPSAKDELVADYQGLEHVKEAVGGPYSPSTPTFLDLIVDTTQAASMRPQQPTQEVFPLILAVLPENTIGNWKRMLDELLLVTPSALRVDLGKLATATQRLIAVGGPTTNSPPSGPDSGLVAALDRFIAGTQRVCGLRPDDGTTTPGASVTTSVAPDTRPAVTKPTPQSRPTVPP